MRRAVYPGTFDPITLGHLDVLKHAVAVFDEVIVAVLHNPAKQPLFSLEARQGFAADAVRDIAPVRVDAFSGLLVDYCRLEGCNFVVRGIRNVQDAEVEMQLAHMNQALYNGLHTVLFATAPEYSFVSSSLIKDVAAHGGDVSRFVTQSVRDALQEKMRSVE